MAKKRSKKDASAKPSPVEERIGAIKAEIAQAMILRNELPASASDEEKAAAAARVERLQADYHEAVQLVLAVKREASTKLEREHKEKKLRHKRLAATRQSRGHESSQETPAVPHRRTSDTPPMDRDAEEAQMDAANEEDLLTERLALEAAMDRESAEELAHQRRMAQKKRRKEEAAVSREARKREKKEAKEKAEAARIKSEKEAHARIRQQDALRRAEETKARKRQQRADREARQRAVQEAQSSGWWSEMLRKLVAYFRGPR